MKSIAITVLFLSFFLSTYSQVTYPIVDTGVSEFYNNATIISAPIEGQPFYGQDATYNGNQPNYTDNGNGTVTDNVTGLMWQQDMGDKISYDDALNKADTLTLGGHSDWRIPTIKELYSLALFTGRCFGDQVIDKFIDTNYFNQPIGNTNAGEREIDAQTWSQTPCIDLLVNGDESIYGYNFTDGRLKGYPKYDPPTGNPNTMYFRMVRGNTSYGINDFTNNNDGTITDNATGLMWQQSDNGATHDWEDAHAYAENLSLAGHNDWRLPNAKELQSIVDYSRSPGSTSSPAIDPLFSCTSITDPDNNSGQYGYYWTSSPLKDGPEPYSDAAYFCFGEAQGQMEIPPNSGNLVLLNVHGAGAQRNDPKTGDANNFPDYFGPQGDLRYVFNFVRCVRDVNAVLSLDTIGLEFNIKLYPNPSTSVLSIEMHPKHNFQKIEIFDLHGKLIKSIKELNSHQLHLDVSGFQKGLYLLKFYTDEENITKKLVIE